jgi:hypothetical protein
LEADFWLVDALGGGWGLCGSIARLAVVEDVQPALIKSVERYAEYFQTLYGIVHRMGVAQHEEAVAKCHQHLGQQKNLGLLRF